MHGHELRAVGEGRFGLHFVDHLGDAFHHVVALQDRRAETHQLGDRFAVARALENFERNDRYGLGIIELQPACLTPPGEIGRDDDEQFLLFARAQMHREVLYHEMLFHNVFVQFRNRAMRETVSRFMM
jgi:hypothetical protein